MHRWPAVPLTGLRAALLGPLHLTVGETTVVLPAGKPRAITALLALSAGRPVSTWRLVDGLWGENPPATVLNALQVHIGTIRKACRAAGYDSTNPVRRDAGGYALDVSTDGVDVEVFGGLLACDPSAADLNAALALWRGEALEGIDAPFAATVRARLHERRAEAREALAAAETTLGRGARVLPMLRRAIEDEPLRETATAALMRALAQAGDTVGALAAYDLLRQRLDDELGLYPSAALVQLQGELLRQEPIAPKAATARQAGDTTHLPPRDEFIGRDDDVARVLSAVGRAPLITLTGTGGVGKTRLVQELLHRHETALPPFAWVPLADLTSAEDVLPALAVLFGVEPSLDALALALSTRPRLVVLDNLEHLTGLAPMIDELLRLAPGLTVLATSRQPLGLPGEAVVALAPLPDDGPALDLLLARTHRRGRDLSVDDDVRELCRAVDGLPLGLELLAGRLVTTSAGVLLAEVRDAVAGLSAAAGGRPARHRSLAAAVEGSWAGVDEGARRALTAATAFTGSWTRADLTEICGDDAVAIDGLVRASLVQPVAEAGRFRLLRPVRQYVLDQTPEERRQEHHHRLSLLLARRAAAHTAGRRFADLAASSVADLRPSLSDLTSALDNEPGGAAILASATVAVLRAEGRTEQAAALVRCLELESLPADVDRRDVLLVLAELEDAVGELTAASAALDQLGGLDEKREHQARRLRAAVLRKLGQPREAAELLGAVEHPDAAELLELGRAHLTLGQLPEAEHALLDGLREAQGQGPNGAATLVQLARVRIAVGDADGAIATCRRAHALLDVTGDRRTRAMVLRIEGGALELAGRLDEAHDVLVRGLELARRSGAAEEVGGCLINLGLVHLGREEFDDAARCDEEAAEIFTRAGHQPGAVIAHANLAEVLVAAGDAYSATVHAERALQLAIELDDRLTAADARLTWARALVLLDRPDEARAQARVAADDAAASGAADLVAAAQRLVLDPTTARDFIVVTQR